MLITRAGVSLAPFYDLVSTALYRELTDRFALKIGGENRPDWMQKRHWARLADISGANPRIVWSRIAELAEAAPEQAKELAPKLALEKNELAMIEKLFDVLAARAKRLPREKWQSGSDPDCSTAICYACQTA